MGCSWSRAGEEVESVLGKLPGVIIFAVLGFLGGIIDRGRDEEVKIEYTRSINGKN